jgi:hypothetical protein
MYMYIGADDVRQQPYTLPTFEKECVVYEKMKCKKDFFKKEKIEKLKKN